MIRNSEILITGGYGFIGGYIAQKLSESSYNNKITILDNNIDEQTTGNDLGINKRNNVTVVRGSILNFKDFEKLDQSFDYIIHAAGFLGINKVALQQLATMDVNIIGTRNCLEYAKSLSSKPRVLIFSTSEVYGVRAAEPRENQDSCVPNEGKRWCYAASKISAEHYLKAYVQEYGLLGSAVRPFNVFGAYRYGDNAMTTIVRNAVLNNEIHISGNGQQVRSWCSIDDFCNGIIAILEHGSGQGDIYNIGNPHNQYTMQELAELIVQLVSSNSKIIITNSVIDDVLFRVPNIDKAIQSLGFDPNEDFKQSLEKVVKWIREKEELYIGVGKSD